MRLLRDAVMTNDWRPSKAAIFVFFIWALAAAKWPLNDLVVPWDSKNQFYTFFRFLAEEIHEGSIPFWNPYHYGGHPSIADPQSFLFSPLFLFWAFLDATPTLKVFDLVVYGHLLVGGLALCHFGRKRGWTTSACILGASIFMFGGPASSRLNHVGIIIAYGLFPLCLLLVQKMVNRPSLWTSMLCGVGLAFMILGRAQVPFMLASLLLLYFVHECLSADAQDSKNLKKLMASMAVALLVAFCVVAIPMALTLQFAEISNRPDSSLDNALRSSLNPINLLTFFIPNIFGSLSAGAEWGPSFGNSPLTDSTDKSFNYLFCGTFSIILLLWRLASRERVTTREDRSFFVILVLFFLYALGRYTPVFEMLFTHIPGISKFRRPVDATFIMILALAYVVPGILTRFQKEGLPQLSAFKATLVVTCLISLLIAALSYADSINHLSDFNQALVRGMWPYLLAASAAILCLRKNLRTVLLTLAAFATSGELVFRNAANPLNAEPQAYYVVLEQEGGLAKEIMQLIREDIDQRSHSSAFRPRIEISGLGGPWQNAAMVLRLEATNGYNPLRIGAYDRLVSPGEVSYNFSRKFTKAFPSYNCALAQKLGLEYLVVGRPIEELRRNAKVAHVLNAGPKIWVYRLEGVQPRVSLSAQYRVADYTPFISGAEYPSAISGDLTLVDAQPQFLGRHLRANPANIGTAQIVSYEADRIEIDVQSDAAAVLTLNDIWYPGWKVYVDGQERRVLKSDVLFRGVRIEPEDRKVIFQYEPFSADNLMSIVRKVTNRF